MLVVLYSSFGEVTALAEEDKVAKDYDEFESEVEELAKKEIEKIKRRAAELKQEAEKVGESVEASLGGGEVASEEKKG